MPNGSYISAIVQGERMDEPIPAGFEPEMLRKNRSLYWISIPAPVKQGGFCHRSSKRP